MVCISLSIIIRRAHPLALQLCASGSEIEHNGTARLADSGARPLIVWALRGGLKRFQRRNRRSGGTGSDEFPKFWRPDDDMHGYHLFLRENAGRGASIPGRR
jgi:hypothetical protein